MRLVDIQKLTRSYGSVRALDEVNLALEPGTIGLVGNNGAGKSTLLKVLLGLLRPDSGGGSILGFDLARSGTDLRGRVGYMPETAATVPVLKGVEFIRLAGDLYGMPRRDARRRAHEVLDYVGLGELRYRRLEEYSVGNLQRLKLAAALVHDPKLLLLDEPTVGLDPAGRSGMLLLIRDLIAETGKSVILCTHLLGDVQKLCDQVVILHQGTVLHCGTMAGLQATLEGRFDIAWRGPDQEFRQALVRGGAELIDEGRSGSAAVVIPPSFGGTLALFETARSTGVMLTQVCPQEEDLARLFMRLTAGEREAIGVGPRSGPDGD